MQVFSNPFFYNKEGGINSSLLSAEENSKLRGGGRNNESTQSLGKNADQIKKNFMKNTGNNDKECDWRYSYAPSGGENKQSEVVNVSRLVPMNTDVVDYDRIFSSETESSRASESFLLPAFENAQNKGEEEIEINERLHTISSINKFAKGQEPLKENKKDDFDFDIENINIEEELLNGSFVDRSMVSILNSSVQKIPYPNTKVYLKENEQAIKTRENKISNAIKEIDHLLNKHQSNPKEKQNHTISNTLPTDNLQESNSKRENSSILSFKYDSVKKVGPNTQSMSRNERSPIEERLKKLEKLNKIEKEMVKNDLKVSRLMPENNQIMLKKSTILKSPVMSQKKSDFEYYTVDKRENYFESTASSSKGQTQDSYSKPSKREQKILKQDLKRAEQKLATKNDVGTSSPGFPEVFCIDCEEYIRVDEVDDHSTRCLKAKKDLKRGNSDHLTLGEINSKIAKANFLLKSKIREFHEELEKSDCLFRANKAKAIITNIMENNEDITTLKSDEQELLNINSYISKVKDNFVIPLILVLTNRASVLSKQKSEIMRQFSMQKTPLMDSDDDGGALLNQLKLVEKEARQKQAELEMWKVQSEMLEEAARFENKNLKYAKKNKRNREHALSNITSDVDSDTKSYSLNSDLTDKTNSLFENEMGRISMNPDQSEVVYKRQFYTQAVALKLELPREHPARDLLISDLFEKAQRFGISSKEWPSFIKREFSQAERI